MGPAVFDRSPRILLVDDEEVDCDPERVAQVLRVPMDSAIVHTPPATGTRVSTERVNEQAGLAVSDDGLRIKRKTMPPTASTFTPVLPA